MIIESVCPYCGCSCRLGYRVEDGKIVGIEPLEKDVCSEGKPCIKGLTVWETVSKDRIKAPMKRKGKRWISISWVEAYSIIKKEFSKLKPDEMYFVGPAGSTNETCFLFQKLVRDVFKSDNIDTCARLCHAATGIGFKKVLGIGRVPNKMNDVLKADLILAFGTNPKANYPVFFHRIEKAREKGAKLVSVDVDPHDTSIISDLALYIDSDHFITLISGLIHETLEQHKHKVKGKEELRKLVSKFKADYVCRKCKIKKRDYQRLVKLLNNSKKVAILHGMGLTQHTNGTQNVIALSDLGVLKNATFIPMRGKVNVQGADDMDCRPLNQGLTLTEAVSEEKIKAFYIFGSDIAKSMPDLNKVHKKLKESFVVLQTPYPCKTMEFADLVLPSSLLFEMEGTITNGESRVRRVNKVVDPPHKKPDWKIICELAEVFGTRFNYKSVKDVFKDIIRKIPEYRNLKWESVDGKLLPKRTRKRLVIYDTSSPDETVPSKEYPFILTTLRSNFHFVTGEMTLRSKTLKRLDPKPYCYMNREDAKRLKVKDGDWVKIVSKTSSIKVQVKLDPNANKGIITIPYHFDKVLINKLFPLSLDPVSKTPNLKAINVAVLR